MAEHTTSPTPRAQNLARASWIAPLVAMGLSAVPGHLFGGAAVKEGLMFFVVVAGFAARAIALAGIRRYGRKRILALGLTGLVINSLWILIWGSNYLTAYGNARAARRQ